MLSKMKLFWTPDLGEDPVLTQVRRDNIIQNQQLDIRLPSSAMYWFGLWAKPFFWVTELPMANYDLPTNNIVFKIGALDFPELEGCEHFTEIFDRLDIDKPSIDRLFSGIFSLWSWVNHNNKFELVSNDGSNRYLFSFVRRKWEDWVMQFTLMRIWTDELNISDKDSAKLLLDSFYNRILNNKYALTWKKYIEWIIVQDDVQSLSNILTSIKYIIQSLLNEVFEINTLFQKKHEDSWNQIDSLRSSLCRAELDFLLPWDKQITRLDETYNTIACYPQIRWAINDTKKFFANQLPEVYVAPDWSGFFEFKWWAYRYYSSWEEYSMLNVSWMAPDQVKVFNKVQEILLWKSERNVNIDWNREMTTKWAVFWWKQGTVIEMPDWYLWWTAIDKAFLPIQNLDTNNNVPKKPRIVDMFGRLVWKTTTKSDLQKRIDDSVVALRSTIDSLNQIAI